MISCENLSKSLSGQRIIGDVSLTIGSGERIAIRGRSGTGKTTFLKLLAGLDEPDCGRILMDGELVSGPDVLVPPDRRQIGFAFQTPALWPHLTIADNIAFGMHGADRHARRKRIRYLLSEAGLMDFEKRHPTSISLGQAHRVGIVRALAPHPRHLFLDEPFTGLDAMTAALIRTMIDRHYERNRPTIVLVTHDDADLTWLGGPTYSLADGRLRKDTDCREEI
ncbi:MAG: ATP-binding cassette domain-containing protein [Pseudomonadota bacterium]